MTTPLKKQGLHRAPNGRYSKVNTLSNTLQENSISHRESNTNRAYEGIQFPYKDGRGVGGRHQVAQGGLPPFIGNSAPLYPRDPVPATKSVPTKPRRATKSAQRRLMRHMDTVSKWWASLPTPRPWYYTPSDLQNAIGMMLARIAAALRAHGWVRITRSINGRRGPYWLPPDSPIASWSPYTARQFACI